MLYGTVFFMLPLLSHSNTASYYVFHDDEVPESMVPRNVSSGCGNFILWPSAAGCLFCWCWFCPCPASCCFCWCCRCWLVLLVLVKLMPVLLVFADDSWLNKWDTSFNLQTTDHIRVSFKALGFLCAFQVLQTVCFA